MKKIFLILLVTFISLPVFADTSFVNQDISGDVYNTFQATINDFNNDGFLDIYTVGFSSPYNILWLNDGNGNFSRKNVISTGASNRGVSSADFNNDGYVDVYVTRRAANQNRLFINDGAGNFSSKYISGDLGDSYRSAVGDVNGDTYPDIYVTNYSGEQNRLFINDGAGNFSAQDIEGDFGDSYDAIIADLNGDTYPDIYVVNKNDQQNRLFINDGAGNFSAQDIEGDFGNSYSVANGDIDSDGDIDLFVVNSYGQNKLWINDGAGNFSAQDIEGDLPGDSRAAVMVDLDGDSYLDIYIARYSNEQNKLWINDGAGNFSAQDIEGDINYAHSVNAFDVDNDEDSDLYVVAYGDSGQQNKLWINETIPVVVDVDAPVINLVGDSYITIDYGSSFIDPGATCTDNIDVSCTVTSAGLVDVNRAGTYIITYSAVDMAGNNAEDIIRTVYVSEEPDVLAPEITLLGDNPFYVKRNKEFIDPGATCTDNIDASCVVNVQYDIDTHIVGTYIVVYTAHDVAGNSSELTRTVEVVKKIPKTKDKKK